MPVCQVCTSRVRFWFFISEGAWMICRYTYILYLNLVTKLIHIFHMRDKMFWPWSYAPLKSRLCLEHDRKRFLSIAFFFSYNNTIVNIFARQFSHNVTPVLSNCLRHRIKTKRVYELKVWHILNKNVRSSYIPGLNILLRRLSPFHTLCRKRVRYNKYSFRID